MCYNLALGKLSLCREQLAISFCTTHIPLLQHFECFEQISLADPKKVAVYLNNLAVLQGDCTGVPAPDLLDGTPFGALRASARTGRTQCAVLTPSDLFSVAAEAAQANLVADSPEAAGPVADASDSTDPSVRKLAIPST